MTVLEHTVPFFLPIKEAETNFLSSNAIVSLLAFKKKIMKFETVYLETYPSQVSDFSTSFFCRNL
jgi:hypothetical protein